MNYASEDLRHEHESVLFGLEVLEKMAGQLRQTGTLDTKDIGDMVNFLQLFADKCHHGKEEKLLFPAMEAAGIPNEGGPIGQMLLEHIQGRRFIAEMGISIVGGKLDADMFLDAASGYIQLMRPHINKENMILFPMGDQTLPAEKQTQLLQQFEAFEATVMGKGVHEKLHAVLDRFEQKYLKA